MDTEKLLKYKVQIKAWEKSFLSENGRLPSKTDVKTNKEVYNAYKAYNHLKGRQKEPTKEPIKDVKREKSKHLKSENPSSKAPPPSKAPIESQESDEEEPQPLVSGALGPTPQANGKVLSLFDMMSPPQSSPSKASASKIPASKHITAGLSSPLKQEPFKTPTKTQKRLQFSDLTPSVGQQSRKSLMEQLRLVESPTKNTGVAGHQSPDATPVYLGKISKKFSFNDENVGETLPSKSQPAPSTPSRSSSTIDFLISPSPLKSERFLSFGSRKKISDLFNETRELHIDEQQKEEVEKELALLQEVEAADSDEDATKDDEPVFTRKRQKITQKRTTRRWKIKPTDVSTNVDAFKGKDIHEEVRKINDQRYGELASYVKHDKVDEGTNPGDQSTDEDEGDETDEDDEAFLKRTSVHTSAQPQKLKSISNNFQRLKINDPRTKRFKQRMRRR